MVVEEVADNLEEAAAAARMLDTKALKILGLGLGVGLLVGFTAGYVYKKKKITEEAFSKSEEEVERIRDMYARNDQAFKVVAAKPDLEEVVEERGYSQRVEEEEFERPTRPPVPVTPPTGYSHFNSEGDSKRHEDREKDKYDGWSWGQEHLDRRNAPERPYIIHQDEFFNKESEYVQTTYTYYFADETLVNEADEKIDANEYVGVANLEHFGHGTDDWDVLYVRNDTVRLDIEVCRLNKSYEEEVLGLSHDITDATDDETA